MRWWPIRLCFALALWAMASSPAGAQIGAGALVGSVVDQDGAATPGVTVTITALETNASRLAVTGVGGRYVFSGLAPGWSGCAWN